jgi:hypothetical protein
MTAAFDINDSLKVQPLEKQSPQLFNSLTKSDWQALSAKTATKGAGEPASGELSFDGDIYGQNLTKATASLSADEKALKSDSKDSSEYTKDLAKLSTDEGTLRKDVFALKDASPTFADFSKTMEADHAALKNVADGLWNMGLKSQASDTTAYYPLSHYQNQFPNKGTGSGGGSGGDQGAGGGTGSGSGSGSGGTGTGDGGGSGNGDGGTAGSPPPADSTEISGLSIANQKPDVLAKDIGGIQGNSSSITATQEGSDQIGITMKGGATSSSYGDGLLLNGVHNATTDQNVPQTIQLNENFSFTQAQLNTDLELEKDVENVDGVGGTQINTQTGEVDVWNLAGSDWVKAGSLGGPLVAGKTYNLQIDEQDNSNGTVTYTGYDIDGKNLLSSAKTFGDKPLGWAPGDYIQTQLDFKGGLAANSVTGVTESNETLYVKNA